MTESGAEGRKTLGFSEKVLADKLNRAMRNPREMERLFDSMRDHVKVLSPGGLEKFITGLDAVEQDIMRREPTRENRGIAVMVPVGFAVSTVVAFIYKWLTQDSYGAGAVAIMGGMVASVSGAFVTVLEAESFQKFFGDNLSEIREIAHAELESRKTNS